LAISLRRYTDITALIYLLTERRITLLDPQTWDDRNDSHYLGLYRMRKKLKTVLALCFTRASETYHHWRVFANGPSGICIRFTQELLETARKHPGICFGNVKYLTLKEMQDKEITVRDLPFLKRYAFGDEREFRIIYESEKKNVRKLDIPISLFSIDRITLSPWLHPALSKPLQGFLASIPGCRYIRISRSSLISNERWKNFGESARKVSGGI